MSNDTNDHTKYASAPLPTDDLDDEARLASAAACLVGVPPVRLLRLFSVALAMLAAGLHEAAEDERRERAKPMSAGDLLRARIRTIDDALVTGEELGRARADLLTAERRRLAGLLAERPLAP